MSENSLSVAVRAGNFSLLNQAADFLTQEIFDACGVQLHLHLFVSRDVSTKLFGVFET